MPRRASASTTLPASVAVAISAPANSNNPNDASTSALSSLPSSQPGSSTPSTSNAAGPARPRRIMPSRSRRGGPGVGTSDVDTQILETLRRRRENDPLIPAHTQLLLTTDSARVRAFATGGGDASAAATAGSELNTSAYERYFDKPEVIRAYREQQLIQTPEYTILSEHEAVGGRFRPRGQDDEGIDTSDAAYEKRHRKYETFEKRQRLREKEKLKHEQYKLKERIEQLRALEPSAFLHVADSFFASSLCPPPPPPSHPEPTTNGNASHNSDGEWRKRQILEVASSLEARYRTLLDTAPSRAPEQPTPTPTPTPAPVPPPPPKLSTPPVPTPKHHHTPTPAPVPAPASPVVAVPRPQQQQRVLPLPEPDEIIELDSDGEEQQKPERVKVEHAPVPATTTNNETLRLRIRFPTRPSASALPSPSPAPVSASGSPSPTRPRPKPIFKNPAAPGPYARVPFARRVSLQDLSAVSSSVPATPSSPSVPPQAVEVPAASTTAPPAATTTPTLRRRPARAAAANPKPTGPITSAPAGSSPPAHAHSLRRPRKRRRVEDGPSPASDGYDDKAGADESGHVAVEAEEEEEGEEEEVHEEEEEEDEDDEEEDEEEEDEEGRKRGGPGAREQQRERWRESALYREAQRHAGTPSARKTHRHLGIFGLRGFPAEIEHMRDFVLPEWALPRDDLRLAETVPVVGGAEGVVKEPDLNQVHLDAVVVAVTLPEDGGGEKTVLEMEPGESDPMVTVDSPKTVDSQETEDLMLFV